MELNTLITQSVERLHEKQLENSGAKKPTNGLQTKSTAVMQCRALYKSGAEFVKTFAPQMQASYCREANLQRVFMGKAPTLTTVTEAFGEAYTRSWVYAQVFNLAEMAGTDAKFSREQMEEMITLITNEYGWLKVSELMFFFYRIKQGKYGKFYGAVDFYTITEALCKFMETRHEYIAKFERETEQERETRERDESAARAQAFYAKLQATGVTIEEWLKNPNMKLAPTSA